MENEPPPCATTPASDQWSVHMHADAQRGRGWRHVQRVAMHTCTRDASLLRRGPS